MTQLTSLTNRQTSSHITENDWSKGAMKDKNTKYMMKSSSAALASAIPHSLVDQMAFGILIARKEIRLSVEGHPLCMGVLYHHRRAPLTINVTPIKLRKGGERG